jgi:signal transduction histidine kinase
MVDVSYEIVLSFIASTVVLLVLVVFIVSFAFLFQRRQNQFRRERHDLQESYEREILQSQLEIQNHTLQQIGQELHDHIGQMLSLAMIQLSVLEEELAETQHALAVKQTFETVERTMEDVRQLSKTLDSGTVQRYGLRESLSLEMERIQRTGRFQTKFFFMGSPYTLGEQTETILFRMAQESLNNAMKHSGGHNLSVSADYGPDRFILIITDDGSGFDVREAAERGLDQSGSGLVNLKQRARLLGGECILTSQPAWGTRIEIRLPRVAA